MNRMKSFQGFLEENKENGIFAVAKYIEGHIAENWQTLLEESREQLLDAYDKAGDMAYGTYLNLLFLPIHKELKQAGLTPEPRFPGDFDISREWGTVEDQSDQQRWMWSTVNSIEGESLGTIVTIVFHDHTQFRVPRQPQVIALTESGKEAVVQALSNRSEDFKNALEFTVEYELYLQSQQNQG